MSLFSELNRRNVIRVGAAYIAVAWLIIQVAETLQRKYLFVTSWMTPSTKRWTYLTGKRQQGDCSLVAVGEFQVKSAESIEETSSNIRRWRGWHADWQGFG